MVYERWSPVSGVDAWLAWLPDVPGRAWDALYHAMDPQRKARCDRYRRQGDRQRCILADALARHAIGTLSGIDPAAIAFARWDRGKPYVPDSGVHFSLSHSGDAVLCAVAPVPVGADVQRHRRVSDALLRRAQGLGCPDPDHFFPWWTAREAAGKVSGQGLTLAPLPTDLRFWHREVCREADRYTLCLCARAGDLPTP